MELSGEQHIRASREVVWDALNDTEVLRRSIPGCQSLERLPDDRMQAVVEIKIGPIGARFTGMVTLSDQVAPESYTISGEGVGGTVGNARGGAKVRLSEVDSGTLLSYAVDAQVGGRLAQLGGPIIDATARQLASKFFRQFGEIVEEPENASASPAPEAPLPSPANDFTAEHPRLASPGGRGGGRPPAALLLGLLSAALIGFIVGRSAISPGAANWVGLSIGLLVVFVAAAAFEFGRRAASPIINLDADTLGRLFGKSA